MERRPLDVTLISATGLSATNKCDVYAVICSAQGRMSRTPVHKNGGSEPTWNHLTKFTIHEASGREGRLSLVVKIKARRMFFDKTLGYVNVPIKDLMEGIKDEGNGIQVVTYQVTKKKSKEPKGSITFSYKFGAKYLKRVPVPYSYPQYQSRPQTSSSGFGTGFLAGVLVADVAANSVGGCGGGGCGGGGCGGC